ncbi:MAG: hypothetical protein L0220_34645, partial [Acidobacteria bacterium]|nr:hypothetical protein [Acidobacteriota bacterium]
MRNLQLYLLLIVCAFAGVAMAFLFDDSCQQDGGLHFLFAKWAWKHHELFVGVWSRPLFTFLYSFPALISYRAARLFTVLICLAIAWQTWRLAEDLRIKRAPFAIVLLWLQPSFFLYSADNMTEPIFTLTFVIALRLHHRGYLKAGMFVASLMILARPEGFFLGILWAVWILIGQSSKATPNLQPAVRNPQPATRSLQSAVCNLQSAIRSPQSAIRNPQSAIRSLPLLASGAFIWWLTALIITGDPLFIKHNWPSNWPVTGT